MYICPDETVIELKMVERAENRNKGPKKCWLSGKNFKLDGEKEVRDHCDLTRKNWGASHQTCSLKVENFIDPLFLFFFVISVSMIFPDLSTQCSTILLVK